MSDTRLVRIPIENTVTLIARVLLCVLFIWGGWGKLLDPGGTIATFGQLGLPVPVAAYVVTVVVELGGGLLLLAGYATCPVAVVLGIWCILTALVAHTNFADLNMKIHFLKNVAIAGGFASLAVLGGGGYSVDALLRRRRAHASGTDILDRPPTRV
jgi:putative oxidoreductase